MTAKAARNRRSKTSVSLTLAAVATHATGTPSPSTATLYFVPRLARSVGLGPVRSPARLARTEQLSRIRSGWPRSMPTSRACPWASTPVSAQRVSHRRRVEPLACAAVAVRLRQGVPSRRKRRKVASTRTGSAGGWPRLPSRGGSQNSITVAIRRKILTSKAISSVWHARHRYRHHGPFRHTAINGSCENRPLGPVGIKTFRALPNQSARAVAALIDAHNVVVATLASFALCFLPGAVDANEVPRLASHDAPPL